MIDFVWRIPSAIDSKLKTLLKEHPPVFDQVKNPNLDHFYYVFDLLLKQSLTLDLNRTLGYVPLYSNLLQKNMTHQYKVYLGYLEKHKMIKKSPEGYTVGKNGNVGQSFAYRISFPYENGQTLKLIPIRSEVYKKKRREAIREKIKVLDGIRKVQPHLTKWFNSNLRIDAVGARKWVDNNRPYQLSMGGIRGYAMGKVPPQHKRLKALYSIEKFYDQNFNFTIGEEGGRFYSNLTNMKRELRQFVSYEGQKLVNIDIKCSQPFFSQLLFKPEFYRGDASYINIYKFPDLIPISINIYSFILLCHNMSEDSLYNTQNQDINKYFEWIQSGEFYERIHREICENKGSYDKGKMKEITFLVFFSDNRFFHQDGTWFDQHKRVCPDAHYKRMFEKSFPTVYMVFKEYKRKNNANLAILLQRIESTIILKHIVPRIASERPDLPIFTIHDSVVTTQGNEGYVEQVMREEILRLTGLNPKFGIEYWGSDKEKMSA